MADWDAYETTTYWASYQMDKLLLNGHRQGICRLPTKQMMCVRHAKKEKQQLIEGHLDFLLFLS